LFVSVSDAVLLKEKTGPSKANQHYQVLALEVVTSMIAQGLKPGDSMVIAFYKAEVRGLKRLFRANKIDVEVATVDSTQGGEKEFVVVDMVTPAMRKAPLGLLRLPERLNVALSRARSGRIVIGDADMKNIEKKSAGNEQAYQKLDDV
jgi:regulator of nonsense transcripts 1